MRRGRTVTSTACFVAACTLACSECSLDEAGIPPTAFDAGGGRDAGRPLDAPLVETSQADVRADGALPDGTHPDGSLSDGTLEDGARRDAKLVADARRDAPPEASVTWCSALAPAPLFCDDFDTDDPVLVPPWDAANTAGGAVAITSTESKSLASSALLSLDSTPTCQPTNLTKAFTKSYGTLTFSFDLYPDSGNGQIACIGVGADYEVDLAIGQSPGETYVQQDDALGFHAISFDTFDEYPTPDTWVRVGLEIALPPTGSITVTIDGAIVHTTAIDPDKMSDAKGPPTLFLGPTCYNLLVTRQLYYDNVVFDAF